MLGRSGLFLLLDVPGQANGTRHPAFPTIEQINLPNPGSQSGGSLGSSLYHYHM